MAFMDDGESLEPYLNRKTLFVKDIDPGHSKNDIKAELLVLCPVSQGKICVPVDHQTAQPLNYAYCNFNRREDAEEAFRTWRFSLKVKGKQVRVTFAVEKKENLDRVCGPWGRKFFIVVRNLQPEVNAAILCKHFEEVGEVFFCKVDDDHYGNRYGVIQYVHEKSVRLACEQTDKSMLHGTLGAIQVELLKNSNSFPMPRYSMPTIPADMVHQSMQLSMPMMHSNLPARLSSGSIGYGPSPPAYALQPGYASQQQPQYPTEFVEYATSDDTRTFDSSTDTFTSMGDTYMYTAGTSDSMSAFPTTSPFSAQAQQQHPGFAPGAATAALGGVPNSDMFPAAAPSASQPFTTMPMVPFQQEESHRSFPTSHGSIMDDLSSKANSQDASARRPALKACVAMRAVYKQMDRLAELLCCPITQEQFQDPVIAADGHSYERKAIEAWLETNNTSPLTNEELPHKALFPNRLLKTLVSEMVA